MITRTPSRCACCGHQLGQAHARGCVFARLTIRIETCCYCGGAHKLNDCPWKKGR